MPDLTMVHEGSKTSVDSCEMDYVHKTHAHGKFSKNQIPADFSLTACGSLIPPCFSNIDNTVHSNLSLKSVRRFFCGVWGAANSLDLIALID